MLAWGGPIRAVACGGHTQSYGVYISGSAQDEEVGVGAMEETEPVLEGSDDAVFDQLAGVEPAVRPGRVGSYRLHGRIGR